MAKYIPNGGIFMDFILTSKLVEADNSYTLIVYVNPQTTEFGLEFDYSDVKRVSAQFQNYINDYIKTHYPKVKIAKISLMVGGMLFATIPLESAKVEAADFNMSYLFFGSTNTQINYVDRTNGSLQVVSPSYFDLNSDGSLQLSQQFDQRFVDEMHTRGVKVVPFLSNHWDRNIGRTALQNKEKLAQQVADAVYMYNLDGVNVDIENVTEVDRQNYTDLVRLIREKTPKDKEVSVAVAANPNGWTLGWHGSYDYKALSEHADYLMVMAYDESYPGGPPGPVASHSFVEKSIQYALKYAPAEKIVMGIPLYGRYWIEGKSGGGYGISSNHVDGLVSKYNGSISFDEQSQTPKATFTIKSTDPISVVSGRTLEPGTYTVWYDNDQSIKKKIELVHKYNIKGTGSWALGHENPSIWSKYTSWLKGPTPIELTGNFKELFGVNRYETSIRISQEGWATTSEALVLGRGDIPIDALTGSVLAKKYNSPLLLTPSDQLPLSIKEEIGRLKPTTIYLAGGTAALSKGIEDSLTQKGYKVLRLAGTDRYSTSVEIANAINNSSQLIITTGNEKSPDALSIAPYAGIKQIPVVFTEKDKLPDSVTSYIKNHNISEVILIGGSIAISPEIETQLKQLGIQNIERIAGADRYETSVAIANRFKLNFVMDQVYFASGDSFIDALPGSPLAAMTNGPIILTGSNSLPPTVENWITENISQSSTNNFLGGQLVISNEVRARILQSVKK
jgi:spore germination protein YaaH/putative cell wall-binding protein